jgi:hypothetical protein
LQPLRKYSGDERTQRKFEKKTKRRLELPYQFPAKRPKLAEEVASHSDKRTRPQDDVLRFLKSRPQIGELQKAAAKERKPAKNEGARTVAGEEAADFLDDDRFKGMPSAWQRSEAVDAFLKRAPVMDPASSMLGGW